MNPQEQVVDHLRRLDADHEIVPCDPALADTAAFCEAYGYSPDDSANTIIVVGKGETPRPVACVVLASTRLDVNGLVRKRLEVRKASFASAEETMELTGMEIGGVTAFALPSGLPIWVDAAVMARERIILGGGSRSIKILTPPSTLTKLDGATVIDGLARARE
ncbi:MAG TPA: YbaK/EbsC family protein [Ilumatobacteraceae bacterium]|nr:YbaK/EbsC family protein [Ilumatobacteraceae bacterium]